MQTENSRNSESMIKQQDWEDLMKRAEKLEKYAQGLKKKLNQVEANARERGVDLRAMGIISGGSSSDLSLISTSMIENRSFFGRSDVENLKVERMETVRLNVERVDVEPIIRQLQQNNAELEERILERNSEMAQNRAEIAQCRAEIDRLQSVINQSQAREDLYSLQAGENYDRPKSIESLASSSGRSGIHQSFGSAGDFSKFPEADRHLKESQAANSAHGNSTHGNSANSNSADQRRISKFNVYSMGIQQLKIRLNDAEKSLKNFRDELKLMADQVSFLKYQFQAIFNQSIF